MADIITPAQIERRLTTLSEELDDANSELEDAEFGFNTAKTNYELAVARTRLDLLRSPGAKTTVQEREDEALLLCEAAYREVGAATARLKAARANIARINTQIDVARSMGASVRSSMDLS